jgi:hypothetical protein
MNFSWRKINALSAAPKGQITRMLFVISRQLALSQQIATLSLAMTQL